MTFRLTCPVCGKRDVYEFTYGGPERGARPAQEGLDPETHYRWAQFRMNRPEPREEWWYHGGGCGVWFSTVRDLTTNREALPSPETREDPPEAPDDRDETARPKP